jgi:hypothetical protein
VLEVKIEQSKTIGIIVASYSSSVIIHCKYDVSKAIIRIDSTHDDFELCYQNGTPNDQRRRNTSIAFNHNSIVCHLWFHQFTLAL